MGRTRRSGRRPGSRVPAFALGAFLLAGLGAAALAAAAGSAAAAESGVAARAAGGYPAEYTIFQLPGTGNDAYCWNDDETPCLGKSSGLISWDGTWYQIDDATDTVVQVPPATSPGTPPAGFIPVTMNSSGEFAGYIDSGEYNGDGAVWDAGTLTPVTGLLPEMGVADGDRTMTYYPGCAETPDEGSLCPSQPTVQLVSIADNGEAVGWENMVCYVPSIVENGVVVANGLLGGCQVGVEESGGSVTLSSDETPADWQDPPYCTLDTFYPAADRVSATNPSLIEGGYCGLNDNNPYASAGDWGATWSPGGSPEQTPLEPSGSEPSCTGPIDAGGDIACTNQNLLDLAYADVAGTLSEIPAPDGSGASPEDINDSGVVVGYDETYTGDLGPAWVWTVGQGVSSIGKLTGPLAYPVSLATAREIDDAGDVVGTESSSEDSAPDVYVAIPEPPPAPVVTGVSPNVGQAFGDEPITITGQNLELATKVEFTFADGQSATVGINAGNTDWNGTSITLDTPNVESIMPTSTAVADVTVTGQGGTSADNPNDRYTFVNAVDVNSVSPDGGDLTGGDTVTITGVGFTDASDVSFLLSDGYSVDATDFTVDSDTEITAVTPDVSSDTGGDTAMVSDVQVTSQDITSAVNQPGDEYVFGEPEVDAVTTYSCGSGPCAGPPTGDTAVTVTGSGFTQDSAVDFVLQGDSDDYPASVLSVSPDGTTITAVTPDVSSDPEAQPGGIPPPWVADVEVTTPAGTSATGGSDEYDFTPVAVTAVSPQDGEFDGGDPITITGWGFEDATDVTFVDSSCTGDDNAVDVSQFGTNAAGTQITVTTPDETANFESDEAGSACPGQSLQTDVVVTVPGFQSAVTESDEYDFSGPVVTGLTVAAGPSAGGTSLTITGFGFTGASEVEFQDAGCTGDAGTVSATVPGPLSVTAGGESITLFTPDDNGDDGNACAGGSPTGGTIPTDVIVVVQDPDDAGNVLQSAVDEPADVYTFDLPTVSGIVDESTGANSGSAAGGDTLTIAGSGFSGTDLQVTYDYTGGSCSTGVDSAAPDGSSVTVTTPDFAAGDDGCALPPGQSNPTLDVVVTGTDPNDVRFSSGDWGAAQDQYSLIGIAVTAVSDQTTGTGSGSIVGGDTLTVTGSGFVLPSGGNVTVSFDVAGTPIGAGSTADGTVQVVSPTTITVTAPDLLADASSVPAGAPGLVTDVIVTISSSGGTLSSPANPPGDQYTFETPQVTAVSDEVGEAEAGSFLGGDLLDVSGSGFTAPSGGFVRVCLQESADPATQVGCENDLPGNTGVAVLTDGHLTTVAPSAAGQVGDVPAGEASLPADVEVWVCPPNGFPSGCAVSAANAPSDQYTYYLPQVTLLEDQVTGGSSGSILGGDDLGISGSTLEPPSGGYNVVCFDETAADANPGAQVGCVDDQGTDTGVQPGSGLVLDATVPDGIAEQGDVPAGTDGLVTDVVVEDCTSTGTCVSSPLVGSDQYTMTVPVVDSVTDPQTGTDVTSIAAGDTLDVDGAGFTRPDHGFYEICFDETAADGDPGYQTECDSDATLAEGITPGDDSSLQVTAPSLLADIADIPPGQTELPLDVVVSICPSAGSCVASPTSGSDVINLATLAITSADEATMAVGQQGSFTVTTVGWLPDGVTFSETGALPDGVQFVDNGDGTATLSGTPADGSGDVYQLTINASDGVDPTATQSFTLDVGQTPSITSDAQAYFTAGQSNSFEIESTGFNAEQPSPDAPSLSESGALPSGVTFVDNGDGTATLAGTPAPGTGGAYNLTITASNGIEPDATQQLFLAVNEAPTITSPATATFTAGQSGSFEVVTTGGWSWGGIDGQTADDYVAIDVSGTLPEGLSVSQDSDSTLSISGTPAAGSGGEYDLTITASNDVQPDATQSFTLDVDEAPAITSGATATFTVGQPGSFEVDATGYSASASAPASPSLSESGTLPDGVTFTDNGDGTATLGGTPGAGLGGQYTFTLTAANGVEPDATQSFTLDVDQAPIITSGASATFTVGESGSFTFDADAWNWGVDEQDGEPANEVSYELGGNLPSGVSFEDDGYGSTATVSGTPGTGAGGEYDLTLTAENGIDPGATQQFTLYVDEAPQITSPDSATFTAGQAASFEIDATGYNSSGGPTGNPAVVALTVLGQLPDGIDLTTGDGGKGAYLSGTPAAGSGGEYDFTLQASNGIDPDADQSFTLDVDQAPDITTADTATFTAGQQGSFEIDATGYDSEAGDPDGMSFVVTSGALPDGVTLSDDGDGTATLSGTPAAGTGGVYAFTISAVNGIDPQDDQAFTLDVDEAPTITSAAATTLTAGQSSSFEVDATGYDAESGGKPTIEESGALPDGVGFADSGGGTATISGTPAPGSYGEYDIVLTASDGISPDATQDFTLTVDEAPTITSGDATTFTVGQDGDFEVVTDGYNADQAAPDAPAISLTGDLPEGVSFVDEGDGTGDLSGDPAPGSSGVYELEVTASNGIEPDATQDFTLTVQGPPGAPQDASAAAGVDSATVSWSPPSSDGGSTITSYTVTASPGGQSTTVGGGTTSATVDGLSSGLGYSFSVTATNAIGTGDAGESNTVVPTSTPVEGGTSGTSSSPTGTATPPPVTAPGGVTVSAQAEGEGTLDLGTYASDPVAELGDSSSYVDVATSSGSSFSSVTFQLCGLPATAAVEWWNPASGSWQPVSDATAPAGSPPCSTVTVGAATSPSLSQLYGTVFAVQDRPAVTTTALPADVVGTRVSDQLGAAGGSGALAFSATGLPAWLSLGTSGLLSGTPTAIGSVSFSVVVTDAAGVTSPAQALSLSVTGSAPALTSAAAATATVGKAFTFTVTASGTPAPAISLSGSLPKGLAFKAGTGGRATVSGTPAARAGGRYHVTLVAESAAGEAAQAFTLTVDQAPAITSAAAVKATVGKAFSYTVGTSAYPVATLSLSGHLPKGLAFSAKANGTATIRGTAAAGTGGVYRLVLAAKNAVGRATQSFTLTVDQAPAFRSAGAATALVGRPFSFTVETSGYPAATLSISGALPAGLAFHSKGNGTGTIAGVPAAKDAGAYRFSIVAGNGAGSAARQTFVLTVKT